MVANMLFFWMAPANIYLFVFLFSLQILQSTDAVPVHTLVWGVQVVYGLMMIFMAILGTTKRSDRWSLVYGIEMTVYGLLMLGIMVLSMIYLVHYFINLDIYLKSWSGKTSELDCFLDLMRTDQAGLRSNIVSLLATAGVYLLASILYGEIWYLFAAMLYFLLVPSIINVVTVYAFMNISDVTW